MSEDGELQTVAPWYILMQYTGLRDKNGKEIYEGDILCYDNSNEGEPFGDNPTPPEPHSDLGVVDFRSGCFDVDTSLVKGNRTSSWFCFINENIPEWEQHEVIGNIHENPELLDANREL
ncbi:MAG: YopX family protein [Hyphomicrobiaceae bacterium]